MAGDWIKMRSNLWDDPRVARLCDLTRQSESTVIGGLYWLWATVDQHSEDGALPGLSIGSIDRKTAIDGFGTALVSVGWIVEVDGGILLARFDEHNGASAKRRCAEAQRKANTRNLSASDADTVRTESGQARTDCGARGRGREREDTSTGKPVEGAAKRGSRLPSDATLPDEWAEFCKAERPDLNPEAVFQKFKDYWTAKPGKQGTKLDWLATWRNWVREERSQKATPGNRPLTAAENYVAQQNAMRGDSHERTVNGTALRIS